MLVKIKGAGGAWTLFDNAERVQFTTELKEYNSHSEFEDLLPSINAKLTLVLSDIDISDPNAFPISAAQISFSCQGKEHIVIFNSIAYICNDQGKTVEKIDPGK